MMACKLTDLSDFTPDKICPALREDHDEVCKPSTKFGRSKNDRAHLFQGTVDRFFRKISKKLPSMSGAVPHHRKLLRLPLNAAPGLQRYSF